MTQIVIVGAGPKAAAIAAKAHVLRQQGHPAPKVTIIDKHAEDGAHWRGSAGYTDGEQRLGTPPDKDIGFPYRFGPGRYPKSVAQQMFRDFSWQAYRAFQLQDHH